MIPWWAPTRMLTTCLLAEVGQDFMELSNEKALLGHGVQVAVQAVDDDDHGAVALDCAADGVGKFAWRQLRRVDPLCA